MAWNLSKKRDEGILNSIKTRLMLAFIAIIVVLLSQTFYSTNVNFKIVAQYKEVTDNLVLENKFSYYVPELTQSYYNLVNSPKSEERLDKYYQIRDEIEKSFSALDKTIVDENSKIAYRGLKNYVMNVMKLCDEGVEDIKEGRLMESIKKYEDIVVKIRFIEGISGSLIVSELSYAEKLQKEIEEIHKNMTKIGFILITSITFGCILFAVLFAKRITDSLVDLSKTANRISRGDLKLKVSRSLLEKKDEIGQLAKRFDQMRIQLKKREDIAVKDRNQLLNAILNAFDGKMGNIATILMRKKIKDLTEKNPRILKIIPKTLKSSIRKEERLFSQKGR